MNMVIVTEFGCNVQAYVERFNELIFPQPAKCPYCQKAHVLIGHGYYVRKALEQEHVYVVKVKRWYCKESKRTVSMLPSFLLSHRQYVVAVVQQVIVARYENNASWAEVEQKCSVAGAPSERTNKRWCASYAEQAAKWLASIQQALAEQDATLPCLDPLGEVVRSKNAASALLRAALELMAWAKTCWAEMADYGLNDRLRFVWHWGAGQGLGRLI